jgi:hypothetical protein
MTPDDLARIPAADPYAFVAEHAADCSYWADLAREGARIRDDALLIYATKKAAAYARAFVGAVKDFIAVEGRAAE